MIRKRTILFALLCWQTIVAGWVSAAGELELRVVDKQSGQLVPVRIHLKDQRGRSTKPPKVPFWKDHFVIGGKIVLKLPDGRYTFEIERGPEYRVQSGHFLIRRGATDNKEVVMQRFVDMKSEGWWSGDLHVHRDPRDIELLMLAEDLHVAPVITWWNKRNLWDDRKLPEKLLVKFDSNRFYHLMAGEDERGGGALLYFNLEHPLPIADAEREHPSPVEFLKLTRKQKKRSCRYRETLLVGRSDMDRQRDVSFRGALQQPHVAYWNVGQRGLGAAARSSPISVAARQRLVEHHDLLPFTQLRNTHATVGG